MVRLQSRSWRLQTSGALCGVLPDGVRDSGLKSFRFFSKKKSLPSLLKRTVSASRRSMHRYGVEDEIWFEAARTALERRAFRVRLQPRSIIIEKDGRLPRIVGSAREFLEFAERQGLAVEAAMRSCGLGPPRRPST